jgi:hypothetical protein
MSSLVSLIADGTRRLINTMPPAKNSSAPQDGIGPRSLA